MGTEAATPPGPAGPGLDQTTLGRRVVAMHAQLRELGPRVARIAIAVHDEATGVLRTFVDSTDGGSPLTCYERPLAQVPSLLAVAGSRRPRLIDDLDVLAASDSEHATALRRAGYRSSYTVPLFGGEHLLGFVFLDSTEPGGFDTALRERIGVYAELLATLIAHDRASIHTLRGAVRTALRFSRLRDEETGEHVMRVGHYARLIARGLPPARRPDDEFIEYLFDFAPLHDLGKIGIPDHVLLKPGRLDAAEQALMRTHVSVGAGLIDTMVREFGLDTVHHVSMLRNVILYHHENHDGSGYPHGLSGEGIPLEARITKVADTFDALTTVRPYKPAWGLDEAQAFLREQAGRLFDPDCVAALLASPAQVATIRERFREPPETPESPQGAGAGTA